MIIPGKNRVQNSNFRLLGWTLRAGLGQNYNQGNLCGVTIKAGKLPLTPEKRQSYLVE